jgi:hypothetical protein
LKDEAGPEAAPRRPNSVAVAAAVLIICGAFGTVESLRAYNASLGAHIPGTFFLVGTALSLLSAIAGTFVFVGAGRVIGMAVALCLAVIYLEIPGLAPLLGLAYVFVLFALLFGGAWFDGVRAWEDWQRRTASDGQETDQA